MLDRIFGTFLGVEFKEDMVHVAVLKNAAAGISLLASRSFPIADAEAGARDMRQFIDEQRAHDAKVFVSVPDSWAIARFVTIPSVKGKGSSVVQNLMKFEIERHIPFPVEDVQFDFLVLERKETSDTVVFAAVLKEKLDVLRDFMEKVALRADAITLSSFAVLNTIELSGVSPGGLLEVMGIMRSSTVLRAKDESNIFIARDGRRASLAIFQNGILRQMRFFPFEADETEENALTAIVDYLTEVQPVLAIERFDRVVFTGDMPAALTLVTQLNERIGARSTGINELSHLSGTLPGEQAHTFAAAVGASFAAMGLGPFGINLLPHKLEYEIRRIAPLATKVFLALIFILAVGIFTTEAVRQRRYITKIDETLKANEPGIREVETLSEEIQALEGQSDFLQEIRMNEITLEILSELTITLPKEAWVTNLNFKGMDRKDDKRVPGELIISGFADSSSSLIPLLEDSRFLEQVEFVGPIKKTKDKEQFKISARVVMPVAEKEEVVAEPESAAEEEPVQQPGAGTEEKESPEAPVEEEEGEEETGQEQVKEKEDETTDTGQ